MRLKNKRKNKVKKHWSKRKNLVIFFIPSFFILLTTTSSPGWWRLLFTNKVDNERVINVINSGRNSLQDVDSIKNKIIGKKIKDSISKSQIIEKQKIEMQEKKK